MKTYEVTQIVEMMITHKVRAKDADEANEIAGERSGRICNAIIRTRKNVAFGDIGDDYIPARDD